MRLPDEQARSRMLRSMIKPDEHHELTEDDIAELAKKTNHYSGRHLQDLVRAAMQQAAHEAYQSPAFRKVSQALSLSSTNLITTN